MTGERECVSNLQQAAGAYPGWQKEHVDFFALQRHQRPTVRGTAAHTLVGRHHAGAYGVVGRKQDPHSAVDGVFVNGGIRDDAEDRSAELEFVVVRQVAQPSHANLPSIHVIVAPVAHNVAVFADQLADANPRSLRGTVAVAPLIDLVGIAVGVDAVGGGVEQGNLSGRHALAKGTRSLRELRMRQGIAGIDDGLDSALGVLDGDRRD